MALTDAQAKIINQTKKKKEKTEQKAASSNPSVKAGSLTLGGSSQLSPLQLAKQDAANKTTVRNKVDNAKQSKASINTKKSVQANEEKQTAKSQIKSKLSLSESDAKLPSASQKGILDAKVAYEQAKTAGDKEGMAKAHQQAEKIRSRFGYSGGVAGSEEIKGPGLTEKDKVTLNKEGQNALLSALTLGNDRRADEIRKAKGFQAADHSTQKDSEGRTIFTQSKEEREKAGKQALAGLEASAKGFAGSLLSVSETFNQAMRNYNQERWQGKPNGQATIVDPMLPGQRLLRESKEASAEALEGKEGLSALLTKAGVSGAQMLPGIAASFIPGVGPAVGATILGAQAAGSKMGELNEQSSDARLLSYMIGGDPKDYGEVTPQEAFTRGVISGGIEGLTERIPIKGLLKIVKGNGGANFLVNIAKQAGTEATEESASTVLNHLADLAAKDPNASLTLGEVAEAAAVGAISGAGFGTAGTAINSVIGKNQQKTGQETLLKVAGIGKSESQQNEQEQTFEQPRQETPVQAETPVQGQGRGEGAMQQLAQRHADVMARIQAAQDSGTLDQAAYDGFVQELNAINQEQAQLIRTERQKSGQVSRNFGEAEGHIDNRTAADVSAQNVKAFQFDHPQLHQYYSQAAEALKQDAEYSFASQRSARGEGTLVQRSEQLARAEGLGLTRQEIVDACNAIINDKGQENYAAAKKVELILDEMLTKGYLPNDSMGGEGRVAPNKAYIQAKQAIPGAVTGFDQYLRDNSLALELGETTEEELRAEFEAMGAASLGFDPYSQMMNKYGTLDPGETPARIIDVPKSTDGTDRVSRFAQNAMEAEVTTEPTIKRMEKMIVNQGFSYKPKKDKQSLERAIDIIENDGIDPALAQWQQVVDGKRTVGKDDMVLAQVLYINAERSGDTDLASRLAAEIAAEGTRMGQGIQALRLLKKATKEGKVYYIRKSVEYVKQELRGRMGDKAKDITLDDDLVKAFMEAEGKKAEDEALDKIYSHVAKQIPPTLGDRVTAWRYFAMLGNPKTHLKNMLGNILFGGVYRGSNQVSALIQKAALAEADRTRSFLKDDAAKEFAKADWEEAKGVLEGDKYSSGYTAIQRKVQENSLGIFNRPAKFSSDKMNQADTWAKKGQYIDSMARFLTARGWDPANLTKEQLETARSHALLDAQRATFTEASDLAETLSKLEKKGTAWNVVIGGTMPFKGVPINIAKQGFNLSPAGLLKSLTYDLYKVKKGERTAAEAIDHISQGLTGSSIAVIGVFLAAQGILHGMASDDEKERLLDEAAGEQEYSLDLGALGDKFGLDGAEYTYTIDWMAPAVLPLFFGAEVYQGVLDVASELGEDNFPPSKAFEIALNAAVNTFEPMMNMTVVSGITDVLRSAAYSQTNPAVGVATEIGEGFISQFVPTLLGQIARTIDDTRRSTFADKNKGFPGLQKLLQQQGNKVPGLSQGNVPYLNVWGETEDTGNMLVRLLENAVSPGYIAKKTGGSTEAELKRLHEAGYEGVLPGMVEKSAKIKDKYVTADQWVNMQTERGKTAKSVLDSFIGTEQYNAMSDDEKAEFVKKVLELSADAGKVAGGGTAISGAYKDASAAGYSGERAVELALSRGEYGDSDNGLYEFVISQESDFAAQEKLYDAFKDKGATKSWAELSKEQAPISANIKKAQTALDEVASAEKQTAFATAISDAGARSQKATKQALLSVDATDAERIAYYNLVSARQGWKKSWYQVNMK